MGKENESSKGREGKGGEKGEMKRVREISKEEEWRGRGGKDGMIGQTPLELCFVKSLCNKQKVGRSILAS